MPVKHTRARWTREVNHISATLSLWPDNLTGREQDAYIVGLLHDVLEDSNFTAEDLLQEPWSIPTRLVRVVETLTHKDDGLTYMEYIARVKQDPLARKVKIADLRHNMDISRLPAPLDDASRSRLERYQKAMDILTRDD